jgi:hypothetical protein
MQKEKKKENKDRTQISSSTSWNGQDTNMRRLF